MAGGDGEGLAAEVERLRAELADCRQLLGQVMAAGESDRREIAQRLHDESLQSLLAAHQDLLEAAPGRAGVTRAHEVVGDAIERLRESLVALHPVTLERGGLAHALSAVCREAERKGGFECELDVAPDAGAEYAQLLLACARELLANAAKHSGAGRVRVAVRRDGSHVLLEVADDGCGIEPGRVDRAFEEGHIGLASLAQRVEGEGGTFEIDSAPGEGAEMRIRLPAGERGGD